jgi:Na+/alanine symporter
MNNSHKSHMSAQFAQTDCSCACVASMPSAATMIMTMDARIMASIIISLILGIVVLAGLIRITVVVSLLVSVLALVTVYLNLPEARSNA